MKRNTKQREEVWQALERTPRFVSAQDLHHVLRTSGSTIGLATVYRTLNALAHEEARTRSPSRAKTYLGLALQATTTI